jgi:carboxymethylenebutenolidase
MSMKFSHNQEICMSEMLSINTPDGAFSAYVAQPASGPAPVIVVLQEIFGVNADMRQSADELAEKGFIAICPDLFWRQKPNVQLSDKTDWEPALKLYESYDIPVGVTDIVATMEFGRSLPGANGKVGLMGYCFGGLMTYLTAARENIDAGVSYYGGRTEQFLAEAANVTVPMIFHVGEEDEYISKDAQAAIKNAMKDKPLVEVFTYPHCAHAFARHRGEKYDAQAASLANGRTASFFKQHLSAA